MPVIASPAIGKIGATVGLRVSDTVMPATIVATRGTSRRSTATSSSPTCRPGSLPRTRRARCRHAVGALARRHAAAMSTAAAAGDVAARAASRGSAATRSRAAPSPCCSSSPPRRRSRSRPSGCSSPSLGDLRDERASLLRPRGTGRDARELRRHLLLRARSRRPARPRRRHRRRRDRQRARRRGRHRHRGREQALPPLAARFDWPARRGSRSPRSRSCRGAAALRWRRGGRR